MSYFRGKKYNLERKPEGRPTEKLPHFEGETAERLASQYKVSRATIERDGAFAAAVDTLAANVGDEVRQTILARDSGMRIERSTRSS